ncbi:pyridoxamine 5'-phosphate oxidase-domain-containing protein [Roridomyces roridus]|uniref:Pyridoxamine 5'-phosphate oxidase-domain-containing protein n=1 Tax=Roridomyces roridus TaxID=1738132 RepID=A0AAD7FBB7_9AGAR|nr:pyridoxamine 5'-phosphate oxidase-domain-containing protein [Roridomyces roridus]
MRLFCATLLAGLAGASLIPSPQHTFDVSDDLRIPTVHESAVMARRILHLSGFGSLSTIFPSSSLTQETRPATVGGTPIGMVEYIADCEPDSGNPTLLALTIATSFKNAAAGSNVSLSLSWNPPKSVRSPASLPRFALQGYLEDITPEERDAADVPACFAKQHRDARAWFPGNRIHTSRWVRLVVQEVYWVGGFGDRAYIGWIPADEWRSVTEDEIAGCVLPGEERRTGWGWFA